MMTKRRILLADDHAMFRQGLRELLEREGFEIVAESSDGVEAVALARQFNPDIAVLDIAMPRLGGFDALRQIRESNPATKVILLSAYEEEAYLLEAQQAGACGYVFKSQASSDLLDVIGKIMRAGEHLKPGKLYTGTRTYREPIKPASDRLTERERQILFLIAEGSTTKKTAQALGISVKTADSHRSNLMQKLQIHQVAGLVRYAVHQGIVRA